MYGVYRCKIIRWVQVVGVRVGAYEVDLHAKEAVEELDAVGQVLPLRLEHRARLGLVGPRHVEVVLAVRLRVRRQRARRRRRQRVVQHVAVVAHRHLERHRVVHVQLHHRRALELDEQPVAPVPLVLLRGADTHDSFA